MGSNPTLSAEAFETPTNFQRQVVARMLHVAKSVVFIFGARVIEQLRRTGRASVNWEIPRPHLRRPE